MKLLNKFQATGIAFLILLSSNLKAQTIETNVPGLVIKNYRCSTLDNRTIYGDLINRNSEIFNGNVRVKIFDLENDTIWQGIEKITVQGQNGRFLVVNIGVGKCIPPYRVQITLEQ